MRKWITIISIVVISVTAKASDHSNLEEELPTDLTDAYPISYLGREFETIFRYQKDGTDSFEMINKLKFGWPRNMELSVRAPSIIDQIDKEGYGDTTLEAFWNFNQETLSLPAFALSGSAELPTGTDDDDDGYDPAIKLAISKLIGQSELYHSVHLNLEYQFNDNRETEERNGRYKAIFGYSRRLNNETMFVTDFVREQLMDEEDEINLLELGLRYQLTPFSVVSAGAGYGISDQSPDFRVVAGVQLSF